MYTILEQSEYKELRAFRTFQWKSSNNLSNTLTETFWITKTSFRMHTFLKYMKMKAILGSLSIPESRFLYDAPGVLSDNLFTASLQAKYSGVPVSILMQRIQYLQSVLQLEPWSANLYYTYDGCIAYEFMEVRKSIRKVKKYSGYVRNASSVGTKKQVLKSSNVPESFEWNSYEELDYFEFLAVGKFSGATLEIVFPDDGSNNPETANPK